MPPDLTIHLPIPVAAPVIARPLRRARAECPFLADRPAVLPLQRHAMASLQREISSPAGTATQNSIIPVVALCSPMSAQGRPRGTDFLEAPTARSTYR
jgi:hypothetical protein